MSVFLADVTPASAVPFSFWCPGLEVTCSMRHVEQKSAKRLDTNWGPESDTTYFGIPHPAKWRFTQRTTALAVKEVRTSISKKLEK